MATHGYGVKQEEQIKVEDSNMFKVGTDEDKAHRKKYAALEPAWAGVGTKGGIAIWRVEHFTLVKWPEDQYGKFHSGDSYIVLQTIEGEGGVCSHHIFFWLGKETTLDEQGTAAYKTVELDDLLDGEPTEHRETEGEESAEFKALFGGKVEYLPGGMDSGFKHVPDPDKYTTRLFQIRRMKGAINVVRCPLKTESLNAGDSFVLDGQDKIYIIFGPDSSPFEKNKANMFAENIENERNGRGNNASATKDLDDACWALLEGGKPDWA